MQPLIKAPLDPKTPKKIPRANARFADTPTQKAAASRLFLKALGGLKKPGK